MEYEQIIEEIKNNLTGDPAHDIPYLREQAEANKGNKPLLREIGRLMYSALDDETREKFDNALKRDLAKLDEKLAAIRKKYSEGKVEEALADIEEPSKYCDSVFNDNTDGTYKYFYEPMEHVLYDHFFKPDRTVRDCPSFKPETYFMHGVILVELRRLEEARKVLEKAIAISPTHAQIRFEYAETFKMEGRLDEFLKETTETQKYCIRPTDLARFYRDMGFYFSEKEMWSEAATMYVISHQYDPESKAMAHEMMYIFTKSNGKAKPLNEKQPEKLGKKYGFEVGHHSAVPALACVVGQRCVESKMFDGAKYFMTIAYDLMKDERIKALIDSFPAPYGANE